MAVTRAKSQLITVGGHAFWQGQSGLPALLAGSSALLRAGAHEDHGTGMEEGPSGALAAATTALRVELADRLQQYLGARGITDLERAAVVGGHSVDLLFTADGSNTAALIDPGLPPG